MTSVSEPSLSASAPSNVAASSTAVGSSPGAASRGAPARSRSAVFYMLLPVLLLGASVLGHVVMVSLATNDPGFSLVPDYYRKASNFEAELEQRRANERLGHHVGVVHFARRATAGESELVVLYTDRAGAPVRSAELSVTAFPIARAEQRHEVQLVASPERPGEYTGRISGPRAGLWELAVEARTNDGRFTSVLRASLGASIEGVGRAP